MGIAKGDYELTQFGCLTYTLVFRIFILSQIEFFSIHNTKKGAIMPFPEARRVIYKRTHWIRDMSISVSAYSSC